MKWKKYTIETTTEATDLVSSVLADCGVEGVEIEDHVPLTGQELQQMFVDIMPETAPDDGTARLHFYLSGETDEESRRMALAAILDELESYRPFSRLGSLAVTEGETSDEDWLNNWKQYFHPFAIDDVLIRPTWEEVPAEHAGKLVIAIDPGAAFGTGSHETTRLCVRAIRKYLKPGDRVLDVGTGSGILAILALKSGAAQALGTDLDPAAVSAARENAAVNGIPQEAFRVVQGNILDDPAVQEETGSGYDLAVANILAPVLLMLRTEIPRRLRPGGVFVMSGIIDDKEADVVAAFEADPVWEMLEVCRDGEWSSVTVRRR